MVECKKAQEVADRQFLRRPCQAIMALACLLATGCEPSPPKAPTPTAPSPEKSTGTTQSPAATPSSTPPGVDRPPESAPKSLSLEQLQQQALTELEQGELEPAWKTVQQALLRSPSDVQTQFIAARILHARGKIQEAIALLDQVPIDSPQGGLAALGQAAEWEAASGRLRQAETRLRKLLELAPQATPAHRLMVRILNVQGRRWESRSHLYAMIEAGDFTQDEVAMLIDFAEPFGEKAFSEAARKVAPDDPLVQLGAVRSMLYKNRFDEALPALQSIVAREKDTLEPWVWLGHVLVSQEKLDQLPSWLAAAPPGYLKHPQFWTIRGRWCELEKQLPEAAKCYAQALQQDPRHLAATARLAECLTEMGEVELAEPVRKRSFQLAQMSSIAQDVIRGSGPPDGLQRLEAGYQDLKDPYMAFAWASLNAFRSASPQQEIQKLQPRLAQLAQTHPMPKIDALLAPLPVDRWPDPPQASDNQSSSQIARESLEGFSVRLEDVAAEVGIDASYLNGADPQVGGMLIYQGNGGGVGVLDFDLDGYCDLYFSNAGGLPAAEEGQGTKSLYWNRSGERFQAIQELARIDDRGYGQGIAAGDFDQDGLTDLLVLNFGTSRLYHNLGDGTFQPWSLPATPDQYSWASSAAIADIDGDTFPDLLMARYIAGEECRTRICGTPGTVAKNCPPNEFPPCPNELLLSDGQGGWKMADAALLKSIAEGRSLGITVTNLDFQQGNDAFYSNDVSANFLLLSQPLVEKDQEDANPPQFGKRWMVTEQAGRRGVAFDAQGRAQACMGIACGDVDRNGLLDLIVTNFLNDVNTLYLQTRPGWFVDGTQRSRLHLDSLAFLGFGCHLTDLDCDGWQDFVVLNGHIDNYQGIGVPYKMVPQVFQNRQGKFYWAKQPEIGSYFQEPNLGRALQLVDFDNDLDIDLVATHLDRPAALLRNSSTTTGHFVQLQLIGTQSERDAVGAWVEVECGEERWVAAITAGDGYMGTGQKLIHLGIGSHTTIDRLAVHWPNGQIEEAKGIQPDRRYRWIEGKPPESITVP